MATINRFGTTLLLVGGLALASLMAYTLLLADGRRPGPGPSSGADDVAIIFPEQNNTAWDDFRRGILACRDLGLIGDVLDARTAMTVRTRDGHRMRFVWTPASGFVHTRQVVRDLMARPAPPVAVVGSENSALTAVLAEALRDVAGPDPAAGGPALLVPWATAIHARTDSPGSDRRPLLEIYPGRTFRVCPDNERQAELLVRHALDENGGSPPGRVVVVSDAEDPFSSDLAHAFREALREAVPDSPAIDQDAPPVPPTPLSAPDASESRWAEAIWALAGDGAEAGPTWLVLPLQGEPTRRLLNALKALAPRDAARPPLRVLCGDGVGVGSLAELAGALPFPVWAASAGFVGEPGSPVPQEAQVMAEIVLALTRARDDSRAAVGLVPALRQLRAPAETLGRSIAFQPSGERSCEDLGQILAIAPGSNQVVARSRRSDGGWTDPRPVVVERP